MTVTTSPSRSSARLCIRRNLVAAALNTSIMIITISTIILITTIMVTAEVMPQQAGKKPVESRVP